MSLWTPSGEHPVRKGEPEAADAGGGPGTGGEKGGPGAGSPGGAPGRGGPGGTRGAGGPGGAGSDPARPEAQLEELRRQLADTPAEVVVANHCYGLFELAAVYLSQAPPLLPQAQLAIDALGALLEGLGARLGEARSSLEQGLAQVRLAYVQMATAEQARQAAGDTPTGNGST
jgi:hypothetical protein